MNFYNTIIPLDVQINKMVKMNVIKRTGKTENVSFDKIQNRIEYLADNPYPLDQVNSAELTQVVIQGLINNIKTSDIDEHSAKLAASLSTRNRQYLTLASRIAINNHQKNTLNNFVDKMTLLYLRVDKNGNSTPIISHLFNKYINIHKNKINAAIDYDRDYLFDYFGFKSLEKGYLESIDNVRIERPQDMIMRAAIQIHMPTDKADFNDESYLVKIFHAYDRISLHYYTPATPTLFNSGHPQPSLTSCFLGGSEDSLEGIMHTFKNSCNISKGSGGVGLHVGMWRGKGSLIRGTNGYSDGIIPQLRIFNAGARAYNQGGGKRKGSWAIYLEMHHPDIMNFLKLKLNDGASEEEKCRDLFPALWISDLFMERVEANADWSVFCPDECPGLQDTFGEEYKKLYTKYESDGKARFTIPALAVWVAIKTMQDHSGTPYVLYKDNVNRVNMQNNLGTIKSSNLCVSGDTQILTDKGYFPIKELTECDPPVHNVWNGEVFTPATFAKTGVEQELLEIETTHGNVIKCTLYHKFIIESNDGNEVEVEAQNLNFGDKLIKFRLPNKDEFENQQMIETITTVTGLHDTYCFKEPLKSRGVFNGMLLGNCTEIIEYSSNEEYASCNLHSICLPMFVIDTYSEDELELDESERRKLDHEFPKYPKMDYKLLVTIAAEVTENIDRVIDCTHNPVIEAARGNFRNRPIGIGIQGLADVFLKFQVPFDSDKARDLNKKISEAVYFGALSKSTEMCRTKYHEIRKRVELTGEYVHTMYSKSTLEAFPQLISEDNHIATYTDKNSIPKTIGAYPTYLANGGSNMSRGKFHWELFGLETKDLSGMFDWESLRDHIAVFGVRNSLVTAYMPTGTTSQIMGYSPCIEPYTSNVYKRTTLAGKFVVSNKYLTRYLHDNNLYSDEFNEYLLKFNGSIKDVDGIPPTIKELYKTAWEIPQSAIMQMAIDRQPFIDQSQSMNMWFDDYTLDKFTSSQFYAWKSGLKTGSYYIRTREAFTPQKFTISPDTQHLLSLSEAIRVEIDREINDTVKEEEEICVVCSS